MRRRAARMAAAAVPRDPTGRFDEWRRALAGETVEGVDKFGTVDWLFREYKLSVAYQERVSVRTRGDYERIILLFADWRTKKGDRIDDRPIKAITPVAADKLHALIAEGRPRQGEKLIALCRRAWNVVHRLHPGIRGLRQANLEKGSRRDQAATNGPTERFPNDPITGSEDVA